MRDFKNIKVAVAGTGYVGLSIATLLAQHHHVTAVDVIPEKSRNSTAASRPSRTTTSRNTSATAASCPAWAPMRLNSQAMAPSSPPSTANRPMPTQTSS